jgi:mannose-6-phosphate isomerase-like protein (cupin superfamily)
MVYLKKHNLLGFLCLAILLITGCEKTGETVEQDLTDYGGKPWTVDIEDLTVGNSNFRAARWTGERLQMTVMSLKPGEEIGLEMHEGMDQFIRIEQGTGKVVMGKSPDNLDFEKEVADDWAIFVPGGYYHNLINTGTKELKLYSIYGPPEHDPGTVHATPADDPHHD